MGRAYFLGGVVFFTSLLLCITQYAAASSLCDANAIWTFASQDRHIAWLYRFDGVQGIAEALNYYNTLATHDRPVPYLPAAWQTGTTNLLASTFNSSALCASMVHMASASSPSDNGPPSLEALLLLDGLVRYKSMLVSPSYGCLDPYEYPVYDSETEQYACLCADGHVCNTVDDATMETLSATYYLGIAAYVTTSVILVVAIAVSIYVLVRAFTVLETVELSKTKMTN